MKHLCADLKHYADNGYRSAKDWESRGREVVAGATSRADVVAKGSPVSLYTRDQTQTKPRLTPADVTTAHEESATASTPTDPPA